MIPLSCGFVKYISPALKMGERLTVKVALEKHGVYALSQRMGNLRKMGWPVLSRTIEVHPNVRVSEYWMEI